MIEINVFYDPTTATDLNMVACLLDNAKGRNYRHVEHAGPDRDEAIVVWNGNPAVTDEQLAEATLRFPFVD